MESFVDLVEDTLGVKFSERDKAWILGQTEGWTDGKKTQIRVLVSRKLGRGLSARAKEFTCGSDDH